MLQIISPRHVSWMRACGKDVHDAPGCIAGRIAPASVLQALKAPGKVISAEKNMPLGSHITRIAAWVPCDFLLQAELVDIHAQIPVLLSPALYDEALLIHLPRMATEQSVRLRPSRK